MVSSEYPAGSPEASRNERRIVVYTSSGCPRCSLLKRWLKDRGTYFEERKLEDVDVMADLIMREIFVLSAPALEVREVVYTEDQIFDINGTVKSKFLGALEGK